MKTMRYHREYSITGMDWVTKIQYGGQAICKSLLMKLYIVLYFTKVTSLSLSEDGLSRDGQCAVAG